jgi:hypothetical protein
VLALELGPCTAAMLHQFARMDITGMHRMAARLTVTTARVGSLVEYSSEPDPGSTAMADIGAAAVTMAAAATTDAAVMLVADRSLPLIGVPPVVEWLEDRWAVDSAADQLAGPMELAGSTAAVVVVSTVVAEAMAGVDTGN